MPRYRRRLRPVDLVSDTIIAIIGISLLIAAVVHYSAADLGFLYWLLLLALVVLLMFGATVAARWASWVVNPSDEP